jgi:hypothetical protein
MLDTPAPIRSAKFPFQLLEQHTATEDTLLTLVARIEQCRALRDDESAIVERIGKARDMRQRVRRIRANDTPRSYRKWTDEMKAELLCCQTQEQRHAFAKRYGVKRSHIRVMLSRLRVNCNAANVARDGG